MDESRTDTAELTWIEGTFSGKPRPEWDWRNDLSLPTHIHLEPSFKTELGRVFLQLSQDDRQLGIWLDRARVDSLRSALDVIATHSEQDNPDDDE